MKLWERKAFWLSAKKGFFTAQMINTHLSLSAAERKRGPVVQMCAWDAGALQIFNGWSHLPNHPNFPHDREKRSCPRPFSARMFDSIEGLSSRERSFWNVWKAELCLVSTQAEDGSLMPSMQVWTVGFRSAGDVTQHWCLALPWLSEVSPGLQLGRSQATALGSCTPLQVRAIPCWAERDGSHSPEPLNRLLSRSHIPSPVPHSTNVSRGWLAALLP